MTARTRWLDALTYGRQSEETDAHEGAAGSDQFALPRDRERVAVADCRQRDLQ